MAKKTTFFSAIWPIIFYEIMFFLRQKSATRYQLVRQFVRSFFPSILYLERARKWHQDSIQQFSGVFCLSWFFSGNRCACNEILCKCVIRLAGWHNAGEDRQPEKFLFLLFFSFLPPLSVLLLELWPLQHCTVLPFPSHLKDKEISNKIIHVFTSPLIY